MNVKKTVLNKLKSYTNKKIDENTTIQELTKDDIDSLDLLELVTTVEEEYNIQISNEELQNFKTISDIIKTINDKLE